MELNEFLGVTGSWKQSAVEEIENIGGWRDFPNDRLYHYEFKMPRSFAYETEALTAYILTEHPALNPAPLQRVFDAVSAWHTDRCAERVPPQQQLEAMRDRAIMLVNGVLEARFAAERKRHASSGGQTDTTPAKPAAGEPSAPAIKENDVAILAVMNRRSPRLVKIEDVEADTRMARRTITKAFKRLDAGGYTCKPEGPRGGRTLTDLGKHVVTKAVER